MTDIQDDLATLRRAIGNNPVIDDALARVEDEIARLEQERDAFHATLVKWTERAEAAEAEVARLKDGLRRYGKHEQNCAVMGEPWLGREGLGVECSCGYRALLAEDGAADDEAIARTVKYRDAWDGRRLTIEELKNSIKDAAQGEYERGIYGGRAHDPGGAA